MTSASCSSVPSQGIRGWSHTSQAARRPSGESRGPVMKRCRSSVSSRTAARSPAADPSSGTAASTRRTSVGAGPVNSSSTHQTSPPRSTGSAQRSPPPIADTGVRGRGAGPPGASGSYAYSRWSAKWTKTSSGPAVGARSAPAQGRPPYSVTRLRTFHGAGSSVTVAGGAVGGGEAATDQGAAAGLLGPGLGPPHLGADRADVLGTSVERGGERGVDG